jgi:hypothetical protein
MIKKFQNFETDELKIEAEWPLDMFFGHFPCKKKKKCPDVHATTHQIAPVDFASLFFFFSCLV